MFAILSHKRPRHWRSAFSKFCYVTWVGPNVKVGAHMRGKIIQEDATSWISFWPSILVFVNHCLNTDIPIFGANYILIWDTNDLVLWTKSVELFTGFNFGFRPKTQFGPNLAQIDIHLALTDARHVLGKMRERSTRADAWQPCVRSCSTSSPCARAPSAAITLTPRHCHRASLMPSRPCVRASPRSKAAAQAPTMSACSRGLPPVAAARAWTMAKPWHDQAPKDCALHQPPRRGSSRTVAGHPSTLAVSPFLAVGRLQPTELASCRSPCRPPPPLPNPLERLATDVHIRLPLGNLTMEPHPCAPRARG
jgi:hypothetical protein